jgi:hypothetical protein
MDTTGHHDVAVEVQGWDAPCAALLRQEVWSTWLHGTVPVIHSGAGLVLIVPMAYVTASAVGLAFRLYETGASTVLDDAA